MFKKQNRINFGNRGLIHRSFGESGQAILMVVLVMIVGLTVGLSVVARSIISIKTSTEEADSQKALAAAEAGIEKALSTNLSIESTTLDTGITYKADITEVKGIDPFLVDGGNIILQGDGVDIWLVDHDSDNMPDYDSSWSGTVNLYWGNSSDSCSNAALEVVVLSGPKDSPVLKRYAYDPCADRREDSEGEGNHFDDVSLSSQTIGGVNFYYKQSIPVSNGFFVRVIPIYISIALGADGAGSPLSSQGFAVSSTGTSGTGGSQVKRTISNFKSYEQIPSYFLTYGLFSL